MVDFVLATASSLVATCLTVACGWALSKRVRRSLTALFSSIAGLPVQHVYQRQELAGPDLARDLTRAHWIRVLAGRGNELTRDTFTSVWAGGTRPQQVVQVLLPDLRSSPHSWLAKREEDVRRADPAFASGFLAEQVRANANYVAAAAHRHGNASLRFYNLPNRYRVIVTNEVAYLTLYSGSAHGRHSPCIAARQSSLIYDLALSLFSLAWEQSSPEGAAIEESA
ncbi:hypothetical protein [Saccharothrix sp. NRRL B-16314]|uniref:hypothetical protein n=1 Tax=Saccharothrix sp. NRRL B-16314 TaxID=1463825 RepID=UPI0005255CB9|nr:hypothetical protein [Saccharothrix sp. NRRL B-16314]